MSHASKSLSLSRINAITVQINSSKDLHELLTVIMDTARELLHSEASSLLLYDPQTEELIFDVARGDKGKLLATKRIPVGQGIAGLCALERKPVVVNDAMNDERIYKNIDQELEFQTRNLLAVPMMARSQMIGVLEVLNTKDERSYDRYDTRLLTYLSNMAALAILNRQLFDDVSERMEELNCIYTIGSSVRDSVSIPELLDSVLAAIENVLGVSRLSVVFKESAEGKARVVAARGFEIQDAEQFINSADGIVGLVLKSGDPLLVRDLERDLRINRVQVGRYKTSSFISVPIMRDKDVIGVLNAADKKDGLPFDFFEMRVLTTVSNQVGDACARIESRERDIELRNYRKDMETAARIQLNSLPKVPSYVAGMKIATRYEACKEVGGDFYDLVFHSNERISLVIADVAGKGVPAALFMEFSKTLIAGLIPRYLDPVATFQQANSEVFESSEGGIFVTAMLIQLERELSRLRLASAGHNKQLLFRQSEDRIEELSARGAPLGIIKEGHYTDTVVGYEPGDLLLLFTDGITECCNETMEEFGEERLYNCLKANKNKEPDDIASAIFEEMRQFRGEMEPFDDSTLMLVRL